MKRLFLSLLGISLLTYACQPPASNNDTSVADTADTAATLDVITNPATKRGAGDTAVDITEDADAYADYYIVIADTSADYRSLHKEMLQLQEATSLRIDTLGRYYNEKKNRIVLPDDDEDELYAGDYYPRRSPDEFLSLEYLNVYSDHAGDTTIALVTGIYADEARANAALPVVRGQLTQAFVMKSKVYIGCMH